MKKRSVRNAVNVLGLPLLTWCFLNGFVPWALAAAPITLEQSIHFVESDGSDVLLVAGTYDLDTLVGSRLKFNSTDGTTLFLDARATTHSEEIEAPLAVTLVGEDTDVIHIVLLLPNGQAMDAVGSISGTRSRGVEPFLVSRMQLQVAVAQQNRIVQDHRKPKRSAPQPQTPFAQPGPSGVRPAVGGLTNNLLALEDRYVAPTPSLTIVANAMKLQSKSLTSVLVVPPGLQLSNPVEINVEYLSPASPRETITQSYIVETGNRFVRQDLEGNGIPRRQFMKITLTERPANGAGAQFTMNWQVDLDPLYDIRLGSLQFKLLDDCDFIGKSEIRVGWLLPDRTSGTKSFSRRKGQVVNSFDQFQWRRAQVSAKENLLQPYVTFMESDPCPTADCWFGLGDPFQIVQSLPPLVPGKSGVVTVTKKAEGKSCRAEFQYAIRYVLYKDSALSQPTPTPIVLDNQAFSVQRIGTWCLSNATVGVYGPNSEWSCNGNTGVRFRWVPTIPATGQYDVYVRWPNHSNRSTNVPYTVHHAGGNTVKNFNQQTGGNDWRQHGRYMLNAGTATYVEVSSANGTAGADAVQFVRVP